MRELVSNPELCDECMKCERICPRNAIRVIDGPVALCNLNPTPPELSMTHRTRGSPEDVMLDLTESK